MSVTHSPMEHSSVLFRESHAPSPVRQDTAGVGLSSDTSPVSLGAEEGAWELTQAAFLPGESEVLGPACVSGLTWDWDLFHLLRATPAPCCILLLLFLFAFSEQIRIQISSVTGNEIWQNLPLFGETEMQKARQKLWSSLQGQFCTSRFNTLLW